MLIIIIMTEKNQKIDGNLKFKLSLSTNLV